MTTQLPNVKLALSLPPKLLRFFARFPPSSFPPSRAAALSAEPSTSPIITSLNSSSSDPNADSTEREKSSSTAPSENPFRSTKHSVTGNWHDPIYSLRRQADLVKLARAHGVEELLPFTVKGTDERIRKREEHGLRVKGTGVGQKVKGKKWERTMKGRLERRKQAMLEMPKMIQHWKQRGHGRGWKKFPK
ncbi:MAG: hypothetical protein Q9187_003932 [Circinaria calcarea]